jgi:hypothetical protein
MGKRYGNLRKKINKTTKDLAWTLASSVKTFSPENNILLFCNSRGGSTWLLELIELIPNTVTLWEPLHPLASTTFNKELGFSTHQYIPEEANWNEAKEAFSNLFKGKILNGHICSFSQPYQLLKADKMIIKFCHANAMLPWLTKNFNFKLTPIFLVRHPFAVVASQLQHRAWNHILPQFQLPDCPFKDYYSNHSEFLSKINTKEELLTAGWCLSNMVPLNSSHNNEKWVTVYYENMFQNPANEIKKIFDRWDIEIPPTIIEQVAKPSKATVDARFLQEKERQLSKWKDFFNKQQIKKMGDVLQHFNMLHYSPENPLPAI